MCTVIVHIPVSAADPIRMLAVRDEDPARPWDPLGASWPDTHPGVVGVRDRRAGGAWLAADPAAGRIAVLLNRIDRSDRTDDEVRSRGALALDAVAGIDPAEIPPHHGFNLVELAAGVARVIMWDGIERREAMLPPGTHMIAHDDLDDPATERIAAWLGVFAAEVPDAGAPASGAHAWWRPWLAILARSADLAPDDDRAIIRDNRAFGYPTLSLLVCAGSVSASGAEVEYGELDEPGHWNPLSLT